MKHCSLCRKPSHELLHLPIYVSGSEGIDACLSCRLVLTKVAEGIKHASTTAYLQGRKDAKGYPNGGEIPKRLQPCALEDILHIRNDPLTDSQVWWCVSCEKKVSIPRKVADNCTRQQILEIVHDMLVIPGD